MDNSRIDRNPFTRLKPLNAGLDVRLRRGELSPHELGKLFAATGESAFVFRGLAGLDRVILYRTALGTGFRVDELAARVPNHLELTSEQPSVILSAGSEKNRKGTLQPLPAALAADHLQAAGISVEVDGAEGTETRDFHALRACYISDVIRAGADLKQAMTLAHHSDPRLTAKRYARTRLHDLGAVVDKLPTPTVPSP